MAGISTPTCNRLTDVSVLRCGENAMWEVINVQNSSEVVGNYPMLMAR